MIKFFRHIRKDHMEKNKTTKYFKYAIGEIILVVIGILIALQINNWNENRKANVKVNTSLLALKSDLVQDTLLIHERIPSVIQQYELNESLRARVVKPNATLDTLIHITRHEFNPNWSSQILYNTNAYLSLNETGLIDNLPDSLKTSIKNFYNTKFYLNNKVEKTTNDYRSKVSLFVDTYAFGSTKLHDQGQLIDSLIWARVNPSHLAAKFQGISNFKRILYKETKEEMEYSLRYSTMLIDQLNFYFKNQ
jgi:hypothetical protein